MALERERETYRSRLQELTEENAGRFVLIQGGQVVDIFTDYESAIKAGYKAFGLDPFLVKKIQRVEQVQVIQHFV